MDKRCLIALTNRALGAVEWIAAAPSPASVGDGFASRRLGEDPSMPTPPPRPFQFLIGANVVDTTISEVGETKAVRG